ncbi:hypothetical protein, partial [Geodermatophilus maliterrae]
MRDTGHVVDGTTARTARRTTAGSRSAQETARRAWPVRALLGVLLVVLAVVAVVTGDLGARLLLGALGLLA